MQWQTRKAISAKDRRFIYQRDNYTCYHCKQKGTPESDNDGRSWHIDHLVPISKCGTDELDNLVLSCAWCNLSKNATDLEDFQKGKKSEVIRRADPNAIPSVEAFQEILKKYPLLSDAGWNHARATGDPEYKQFAAAVEWIKTRSFTSPDPRKRRRGYATSYGWKHVMERYTGTYATNGAFIAACIFCNVPMIMDSPNPCVGLWARPDDRP